MKKLFIILAIVLCASLSYGADVTIHWDAVTGATGYKIYTSTDLGATWGVGLDVGNVTLKVMTGQVDDKLILYKVSAYSANGESVANWKGAWWDSRKRPLPVATSVGVD